MFKFVIKGGAELNGKIKVSGAKNSALPIMAATLLGNGSYILRNVPDLKDINTMLKVLKELGKSFEFDKTNSILKISADKPGKIIAPYDLVKTMRASILVLGPLLAKYKKAKVSLPGGCAIGTRPVNLHLHGLQEMGAKINIRKGYIHAVCTELKGANIILDYPSVGATENLIMAAALAKGTTKIFNPAKEPEIIELSNFLCKTGAVIKGAGTDCIEIKGVKKISPLKYTIMPDRIEAGTFIIAAALCGDKVTIENIEMSHLESLIEKLKEAGVSIKENKKSITVKPAAKLKAVNIKTMPYPGFPTDMQAQFMMLMSLAEGTSIITETVFENRFMHVSELQRLGAAINIEGKSAVVKGVPHLSGATIMATDLRASAALVLAGLAARGTTEILRVYHIDRGYENIEKKLNRLGASIERISVKYAL